MTVVDNYLRVYKGTMAYWFTTYDFMLFASDIIDVNETLMDYLKSNSKVLDPYVISDRDFIIRPDNKIKKSEVFMTPLDTVTLTMPRSAIILIDPKMTTTFGEHVSANRLIYKFKIGHHIPLYEKMDLNSYDSADYKSALMNQARARIMSYLMYPNN